MADVRRNLSRWNLAKLVSAAMAMLLVAMLAFVVTTNRSGSADRHSASPAHPSNSEMSDMAMPDASSDFPDAPVLVPEGWSASASSEAPGHAAGAVLNGMTSAYWESRPNARLPQSVTIDMGGIQEVSALTYEPRHGTDAVGAIGQFAVTVSTDGKHFGAR